jgi:hypothetical protein
MLATTTWLKVKNSQFITVKGSTRKNITSDLVVWQGAFAVEAPTLLEAQHKLKDDLAKVENFLTVNSVTNFIFKPTEIEEIQASVSNNDTNGEKVSRTCTIGYRLSQKVRVESADVDRVSRLDTTPLIDEGVLFTNDIPQFLYTKVAEDKIEMLADATRDARARAEQIASQGERHIASLHDAEMGIFQITALHESETSSYGENDSSSRDKTITAVVTATFALK